MINRISLSEYQESFRIGHLTYISPNEFDCILDYSAPQQLALNAGYPLVFPRINNYLLIPVGNFNVVTQVAWIKEQEHHLSTTDIQRDPSLINIPQSYRIINLTPLGTLTKHNLKNLQKQYASIYTFQRGINIYPAIGDPVLIPTYQEQVAITQSSVNGHIWIGNNPLTANTKVMIDPDRLFGRHLAVLGNTGSGKSCTICGLIRWSIEAVNKELISSYHSNNVHFIVIDPSGEYYQALKDLNPDVYSSSINNIETKNVHPLQVPFWLWNIDEWSTFLKASNKTQRPAIIRALELLKIASSNKNLNSDQIKMQHILLQRFVLFYESLAKSEPFTHFPATSNFQTMISNWEEDFKIPKDNNNSFTDKQKNLLEKLCSTIQNICGNKSQYDPYKQDEIDKIVNDFNNVLKAFDVNLQDISAVDINKPVKFRIDDFINALEMAGYLTNSSPYIDYLITRAKTLLTNSSLLKISGADYPGDFTKWISSLLGSSKYQDSFDSQISIIDLSLVPSEISQIIVSVITREIFHTLKRRHLRKNNSITPIILVIDEAHEFMIHHHTDSSSDTTQSASQLCNHIFEQIAREGRKYGLSLVIASQRPSELSPTVLSQCNSFILHRLNNEDDQKLVSHLLPDNLTNIIRDLPLLPMREAILIGWATEIPLLINIRQLKSSQLPKSDDPDIWNSWISKSNQIDKN